MPQQTINQLILFGETKYDTTSATAEAADVRSGQTFVNSDGALVTGTSTKDSDTSADTALASEVLSGKTAHARGAQLTGSMANNGSWSDTIDDLNPVTIPTGYHSGGGQISIAASDAAKLVPSSIKNGVTILGVTGDYTGSENVRLQAKTATPSNSQQTVVADSGYTGLSEVTVSAIPVSITPTSGTNGYTITIG